MTIEGDTKVYAVMGHPIAHSLSPAMHNAAFAECGLNGVYVPFDVPPDQLLGVLESMQAMGVGGVNLTVPLKEVAFEGLTSLDDSATHLGAVNTVEFTPAGMIGHNTDGYGFVRAVRESLDLDIAGKDVMIVGLGGSGRAIAITLADGGAAVIRLANRTTSKADLVAAEIQALSPGVRVEVVGGGVEAWAEASRASDLVVNCTSLGMNPGEPSVLPASAFRDGQAAIDLIYMTPDTAFTTEAQAGGARAVNGLGMLLHQGARAFEIWTGCEAPVEVMRGVLESRVYGSTVRD